MGREADVLRAGNPAKPKDGGMQGKGYWGVGDCGDEGEAAGELQEDGACRVRWTVGGRSCRGEGAAAGTSVCPEQVHTPMATSLPPRGPSPSRGWTSGP